MILCVFMRVPGVDRIDFSGVHNRRTPVDSRAHHPTCAHVSDSAESDTQGVRHVKVADVARSAAQAAMEAAQTAQQIAQTGQVPRVETPTVPPTASQPMQTGRVPQIPPLVVPQLTQSSQPLLREPDTSDLGQLPEPIQQSQPIQQPQQQSQPIRQPANPLPPSFEPKPITAEISLVADPTTGEVR